MQSRKFATSLFKALDLLTLLSPHGTRLNVKEVAAAMSLPRSSALRLLDSLIHYNLVGRDAERQYHVTEQFQQWRMGDWNDKEAARLRPLMKRLCADVEELILLGRLEGRHISYVHMEEPRRRVRVTAPVGKNYELQVTAMGKLVMGQRPDLIPADCSAKLKKEIDEAKKAHFAWNIRESEPDLITWATWAGPASAQTHLLVVAWPDFRFSEESLGKIKKIIREESAIIGPFALFQERKKGAR